MASSERNVEEKIKLAQDQLDRLSNKIISIKMDSKESEENYKRIVLEKEKEIQRLNREVKDIVIPIFDNSLFQKEIKSLKEQIGKKIE